LRAREFAIGSILLIIGFAVFGFGFFVTQQYQTPLGQYNLATLEVAKQHYERAIIVEIIGGILGIEGFLITLYGAVAEPKQVEESLYGKSKESIHCRYCREKLPSNAVYCLKCGKKLE
jgi:hypothetical protein